jgi:hypothetical protein
MLLLRRLGSLLVLLEEGECPVPLYSRLQNIKLLEGVYKHCSMLRGRKEGAMTRKYTWKIFENRDRRNMANIQQTLRFPSRRDDVRRGHVLLCHRRIPRFQSALDRRHLCTFIQSSTLHIWLQYTGRCRNHTMILYSG